MALPVRLFHFRRLLNFVSLPFLIKLLFDLYTNRHRRRTILFLVTVIFMINCFRQNMLAYYYMSSGQFEAYKLVNRYAYTLYNAVLGRNSVLMLAAFSYLSFCPSIIYYTLFRWFNHFRSEGTDLSRFAGSVLEQKYTFIDRVFSRLPDEHVFAVHRKLIAVAIKHRFRHSDRLRFIVLFGVLEKLWLVTLGIILALTLFACFFGIEIIYTGAGGEITKDFVLVIASIVTYLVPIIPGCALPFLLLIILVLILFINQSFWKQFCADFRSIHSRSSPTSGSVIYKKIRYGYRVWIETFIGMIKINRYVACEIFAVTIGLTLMGNTILLVELLIIPFEWRVRLVLTAILTAQFMIALFLVLIFLRLRQQLYCLAPLVRHHVVSVSGRPNIIRLRSLWKAHWNIEILCPHRKWAFNLGPLGKITSHNILLKCPALYTALILFILPVVERENIRK